MRAWTRAWTFAVLVCAASLPIVSCRSATQIVVTVRTNMPCTGQASWHGVALYVGKPGAEMEKASATLVTRECDEQGAVGSLVVVPSGDKDDEVGLRVVAGVAKNPEACAEQGYDGCIVARRALRFVPHDTLDLDIELSADCISLGCDPERTCLQGRCVTSRNFEVQSAVDSNGGGMAGGGDTGGQVEQPAAPTPRNIVRCGSDGVVCKTTGDVCCLTLEADGKASGACMPVEDCPVDSAVLWCDDSTDCAHKNDKGHTGVCALSYTPLEGNPHLPSKVASSFCAHATAQEAGGHEALALCQNRDSCAGGAFPCEESRGAPINQLPGYFWCELTLL